MSDTPAGGHPTPRQTSDPADPAQTARIDRPSADDFQPDVPEPDEPAPAEPPAVDPTPADSASPTEAMPAAGTPRPRADYSNDPTRESLAFDPPREPPLEAATAAEDMHLIPGATVGKGRYRLLVSHGGPPTLQFWQALDTALDRQVALTFVDPDGTLPASEVQAILDRTQRLGRIDMPGVARVLDVMPSGTGGLVVSEWIRGGSLAEVADTSPSPIGGARAIQSLAAAAEAAHRSGVALAIDHPARIRVSIDGDVALAFPATLPSATPDDDIRGIGAALYALLINRWPLPESGQPSGLATAELDAAGQPVEPRTVDRDIPFQISAAAARAAQENGGIRSASTMLNLLQQATAIADRTDHLAPVDETASPVPGVPGAPVDPDDAARRRKRLIIGVGVAAAAVVLVVILLATVLSNIFSDVGNGLSGDELGLNAPTSSQPGSSTTDAGAVVKPVRATVFSPEGEADAPDLAGLAIDGDPSTVWPTDTYSDAAPFPGFKNGVGLMLQLPQPTTLGSVGINVNSTGTAVQIRSATSASPSSLDDTTALTQPTTLKPGTNTIPVENAAPTSYVLVWISTLGQVNGKSRTDVSEITLKAAG